jgi:hypothetical protein
VTIERGRKVGRESAKGRTHPVPGALHPRSQKAVVLSITVVGLSLAGCGSLMVEPLPEQRHYADIACPGTTAAFYLEEVLDKRGFTDRSHLGFAKRGLFNVAAKLRSNPPPSEVLSESLNTLLAKCGVLAREPDEAKFLLRVSLLGYQVREVTGMWAETITASLNYETEVVDAASNTQLGRFSASARSGEKSSVDVTRYAERAARDALRKSLSGFLRELGQYQ